MSSTWRAASDAALPNRKSTEEAEAQAPERRHVPENHGACRGALQKGELRQIGRLTLAALTQRLAAQQIGLEVSDAALDVLTDLGYSPEYGARPLKRLVHRIFICCLRLLW